jgi:2-(3-amino-3-carboxypropyl)histidine synthase
LATAGSTSKYVLPWGVWLDAPPCFFFFFFFFFSFHFLFLPQSIMISNPELDAYRYDPYSKKFTAEGYDTAAMLATRGDAVRRASGARRFGIVLGTLGRQGSPRILEHLEGLMRAKGVEYTVVLLSEIFPQKLAMFDDIEACVV